MLTTIFTFCKVVGTNIVLSTINLIWVNWFIFYGLNQTIYIGWIKFEWLNIT